jgi:hypothetical protein
MSPWPLVGAAMQSGTIDPERCVEIQVAVAAAMNEATRSPLAA